MLQHNTQGAARGVHMVHAASVGMHVLCCGLPAAAMLAAGAASAVSGLAATAEELRALHNVTHLYELWILAASAAFVAIGGALEVAVRRAGVSGGHPWLFGLSAACFAFNAAVIAAH